MTGFFAARLLAVALKRDLFTHFAGRSAKLDEIRAYLNFPHRPCAVFLDGLVAVGLLEQAGDRYRNAMVAETYLVKGRPEYQGANVKLFDSIYQVCNDLEVALAEDAPTTTNFAYFFDDEDLHSSNYAELMHDSGVVPSLLLMEYCDFSDSRCLLDVGGGSGRLAATLASQYPHLDIKLFDLPRICMQAQDYLTPFPALAARIGTHPGDFFRNDFPDGADTIVMMRILHDWPDDKAMVLLEKAYRALPPGGRVLIYETMRSSESQPDETFAIALLMLLISPAGKIRSTNEIAGMLENAKFTDIDVTPTAYLYTLVAGRKPDSGGR